MGLLIEDQHVRVRAQGLRATCFARKARSAHKVYAQGHTRPHKVYAQGPHKVYAQGRTRPRKVYAQGSHKVYARGHTRSAHKATQGHTGPHNEGHRGPLKATLGRSATACAVLLLLCVVYKVTRGTTRSRAKAFKSEPAGGGGKGGGGLRFENAARQ